MIYKNKEFFWHNVNKENKNETECWEWDGQLAKNGGIFTWNKKIRPAPRVAYILSFGEIPNNVQVRHFFCNNNLCCNPNHLYTINNYDQSAIKRFWEKVNKGDDDNCWMWLGGKDKKGYGIFYYKKKTLRASWVSYIINSGMMNKLNDERKQFVLHSCDNSSCVNPKHLRLGTHEENMTDKMIRGNYKGENIGTSKLKNEQVLEIRQLYHDGNYTLRQLGKMFNVDKGTIGDIVSGKSWKHLGGFITMPLSKKITQEDILIIKNLYENGVSPKNISDKYNISLSYTYAVINRFLSEEVI